MIYSFRDREAERIFHLDHSRRYSTIERAAFRKLRAIHAARLLTDLIHPPGNRLEALHGNREGQYSIRVSAQWRIFFEWREPYAYEVENVDYH